MALTFLSSMASAVSPTLAANETAARLRSQGRTVLHMGFGEAPFPVHHRLREALARHAGERSYLPVAGLPALREAVREHQARLTGLDWAGHDVLVAPGSKAILFALQLAVPGDALLPVPSWVSYRPQAQMLGRAVVAVPASAEEGGLRVAADALDKTVRRAREQGHDPRLLVLNSPSNPTGLVTPDEDLSGIAEMAERHDLVIVSDEIYARLTFDGTYPTIAAHAPHRTVVTTGLSKHLSLGGWRLGVGLVPRALDGLFAALLSVASETWSCVSSPVQHAAVEAYRGHDDVEAFVALQRRIHADVTAHAAARLQALGVPVATPQGGFYLWPDVPARGRAHNLKTSTQLADALLEGEGILTLPGTAFGEAPEAMRLRLSVCDYDGADALAHYDGRRGPGDVAAFAPRVDAALAGFEAFLGAAA